MNDIEHASDQDRQMVAALARGLQILSSFRVENPLLTNSDLSERSGVPRSSVSRLTHTLVKLGYLEYDSQHYAYRLGAKILSLSYAMSGGMLLRDLVSPHLQKLADVSKSQAAIATCEDFSMLILDVISNTETTSQPMLVGSHMTLDTTAMGRAHLAACSAGERRRIVDHLVHHRGRSMVELQKIVDDAQAEYRGRGYCTSLNGWRKGVVGVAVPLFVKNLGRRILLTCGGSATQMPEDVVHNRIGPVLLDVANQIEKSSSLKHA